MTWIMDYCKGQTRTGPLHIRAGPAYSPTAIVSHESGKRRIRLVHYDGSYLIDLAGTRHADRRDRGGICGANEKVRTIVQAEGWPLGHDNAALPRKLISIHLYGNQIDISLKCGTLAGNPNLIVSLPSLPQHIDFLAFGGCLETCFAHMTRRQRHAKDLTLAAWQLAHDLKFTHPVMRYLRRQRAESCNPHVQALIEQIRGSASDQPAFRNAGLIGVGESIVRLLPHLNADRIMLIDRSPANLSINATRHPGLRTSCTDFGGAPCGRNAEKSDLVLCSDFQQGNDASFAAALEAVAGLVRPRGWLIVSVQRGRPYMTSGGTVAELPCTGSRMQVSTLCALLGQVPYFTDVSVFPGSQAAPDDFLLARRAHS